MNEQAFSPPVVGFRPPRKDLESLAKQFARDGMVRLAPFLVPAAALELHRQLRSREDWKQVFNSGDKLFELDRTTRGALDPAQTSTLDEAVYAAARDGFQYRYEIIRVPDEEDERKATGDLLSQLAAELSAGAVRDMLRTITGADDIRFADAQATAYSPGDFLTGHDDQFAGKQRRAAYVLGLTPIWRIEWGGLLIFHEDDGQRPARAYCPAMNVLTLFSVPQMHSVSEVTRAAAYRRYSVTGWLRA